MGACGSAHVIPHTGLLARNHQSSLYPLLCHSSILAWCSGLDCFFLCGVAKSCARIPSCTQFWWCLAHAALRRDGISCRPEACGLAAQHHEDDVGQFRTHWEYRRDVACVSAPFDYVVDVGGIVVSSGPYRYNRSPRLPQRLCRAHFGSYGSSTETHSICIQEVLPPSHQMLATDIHSVLTMCKH